MNEKLQSNTSRIFSIAKEPDIGSEDACYCKAEEGLAAIADGLSNDSTLTFYWADSLAKDFCQLNQSRPCNYIRSHRIEWIKPLQNRWKKKYLTTLSKSKKNNESIWVPLSTPHAIRKAKGAATFAGIQVLPADENGNGKWEAIAVGDSCIFQLRRTNNSVELKAKFPLEKSDDFSSRTGGITSRPETPIVGDMNFTSGEYQIGDVFILGTDALSEWFLRNYENGDNQWEELLQIEEDSMFEAMICNLLQNNQIQFDDTTFCRMEINTSPKRTLIPEQEEEEVKVQEIQLSDSPCVSAKPMLESSTACKSVDQRKNSITIWTWKLTILVVWLDNKPKKKVEKNQTILVDKRKKSNFSIPRSIKIFLVLSLVGSVFLALIYFPGGKYLSLKIKDIGKQIIQIIKTTHHSKK
ncbi:MAG: hypothetical protein PUP93_30780 [Rhizonema sp. NSF051]|nr:hypothetical protein [Rhizonema sp. NSF051]